MEIYHPEEQEVLREMKRIRGSARRKRLCRGLLISILACAVTGLIAFNQSYTLTLTKGPGMGETLPGGSLVLCEKVKDGMPSQGDLILYSHDGQTQIKRVIGRGGDRVMISAVGEVRVNGTVLNEPYITGNTANAEMVIRIANLEEDEIFVMGDDRDLSIDSRSEEYGVIKQADVIGRAAAVVWPAYRIEDLRQKETPAEKELEEDS